MLSGRFIYTKFLEQLAFLQGNSPYSGMGFMLTLVSKKIFPLLVWSPVNAYIDVK
jgi:hypothetical protein